MSNQPMPSSDGGATDRTGTANEQFKSGFGSWFWGSMIAATVLHLMIFMFWPSFTAVDMSTNNDELETIEIPPEIEIPPPPEQIARPATPVISQTEIDEDITIAPTTFEDNPVQDFLPPPEAVSSSGSAGAPPFTPYTVAPEYTNGSQMISALERFYPQMLKDAGIGGTVKVAFHISEQGEVLETRLDQGSGYTSLDEAAMRVAEIAKFSPALNRDQRVAVWVSFPIVFESK